MDIEQLIFMYLYPKQNVFVCFILDAVPKHRLKFGPLGVKVSFKKHLVGDDLRQCSAVAADSRRLLSQESCG